MTQVSSRIADETSNRPTTVHELVGKTVTAPERLELPELVAQAQGGCAAAFTEIADRYAPRLLRFLETQFSSNRTDAEDVVQESLTKAWQSLATYRSTHAFSTWLYTITYRTAIDFLRRNRKHRKSLLSVQSIEDNAADLADPSSSLATKAVDASEEAQSIWAVAKELLDQNQYAMLWLRYGEDLSVAEVAQVLRKSRVTVRVALYRAKAKIKSHMEVCRRPERGIDAQVPSEPENAK